MNNKELVKYFNLQNKIFGINPDTGDFFRLSECRIVKKCKQSPDWLTEIDREYKKIESAEDRLYSQENGIREEARKRGREIANKKIKKFDKIFTPKKMNPDEAKILFHPVDFLVFNGMKSDARMQNLCFLDSKKKSVEGKKLQKSLEKAIEKEKYEWLTIRVTEEGKIDYE